MWTICIDTHLAQRAPTHTDAHRDAAHRAAEKQCEVRVRLCAKCIQSECLCTGRMCVFFLLVCARCLRTPEVCACACGMRLLCALAGVASAVAGIICSRRRSRDNRIYVQMLLRTETTERTYECVAPNAHPYSIILPYADRNHMVRIICGVTHKIVDKWRDIIIFFSLAFSTHKYYWYAPARWRPRSRQNT